jgi:hypothetical protein
MYSQNYISLQAELTTTQKKLQSLSSMLEFDRQLLLASGTRFKELDSKSLQATLIVADHELLEARHKARREEFNTVAKWRRELEHAIVELCDAGLHLTGW